MWLGHESRALKGAEVFPNKLFSEYIQGLDLNSHSDSRHPCGPRE